MAACSDVGAQILSIIWSIFALIFSICMSYIIILFFKYHCHPNTESPTPPKILFIAGIFYTIITFLNCVQYLINGIYWAATCNKYSPALLFSGIILYVLQTYFLWLILFLRLYIVFRNSAYKLSKCTIIFFISMFTILPIATFSLFNPSVQSNGWRVYIIAISVFVLSILLSLSISIIFLYKLFIIYKAVQFKSDDTFLSLITKNTILVVISISFSVINLVVTALVPDIGYTFSLAFIRHFMFLFDIFTNFICVTLAFQCFDNYYDIFCGLLDKKCQWLCMKMMLRQDIEMKNAMELQASKSVSSSPTSPSF